jgi:hypothetical protein
MRRRRLFFFLVGSKARADELVAPMALWGSGGTHLPPWEALDSERCSRESAAKLLRGRGRQLSSPDARRRREVAGGVVPLFFLDRLSPFFKRGCRSGIRWSQS